MEDDLVCFVDDDSLEDLLEAHLVAHSRVIKDLDSPLVDQVHFLFPWDLQEVLLRRVDLLDQLSGYLRLEASSPVYQHVGASFYHF